MVSLGLGSDVSNHKGLKHLEASRHIFSSQCIQNRHQSLAGRCKLLFLQKTIRSRQINSPIQDDSPSRLVARPVRSAAIVRSRQRQDKTNGGAERDRTADPLLAKQVLSQLSYSPIQLDHPSLINQARQQFASTNSLNPVHHSHMQMVGPGRLELPTPRLSSVCSNQLSYGPIQPNIRSVQLDTHTGQRPSPVIRRPRGVPPKGRTARERKPKVYILLEERETWTARLAISSGLEVSVTYCVRS